MVQCLPPVLQDVQSSLTMFDKLVLFWPHIHNDVGPPASPSEESGRRWLSTPTVEDPEHRVRQGADTPTFASSLSDGIGGPLHSHFLNTHHHFGHNPHYCHRTDHSDELLFEPPKNLTWKQRIKHVTWPYFTLTMATGGIANVISTGNTGLYSLLRSLWP